MKTKSIGYIRVSTKAQEDKYGADAQEERILTFAASNNYDVVELFSEQVSGSEPIKPKLFDALDYCKQNGIGFMIISEGDRLSRELILQLMTKEEFNKAGVRIINVASPNNEDTPENTFLEQIMGAVSELDKKKIVRRMYNGKIQKAKQGKYAGGKPPFGYKGINGSLVPNSLHKYIEKIKTMHQSGLNYADIATWLNSKGIKTREDEKGKTWNIQQVKNIVLNKSAHSKGINQYANIQTEIK
jgi:site-specific DNA recombinase